MKWIGISGGRRRTNKDVGDAVRKTVAEIFERGDGLVTGGALGVDFIALKEALIHDPGAERMKVFLPATLDKYVAQHEKHARLGNIDPVETGELTRALYELQKTNPRAIVENPDTNFTEENKTILYYDRNTKVVEASDELVVFPIKTEMSESLGTMDTVEKARAKGIPVKVFSFDLTRQELMRSSLNSTTSLLFELVENNNSFTTRYFSTSLEE